MKVSFLAALFCAFLTTSRLSTSVRAAVVKYSGNETLSVLLLASSDPSYNSSYSALSSRVNDLLTEANQDGSYQLQLLPVDTQCDGESALEKFLGQVYPASGEDADFLLVAVLGGGCVTDSELIADTIDQWKIPLISYNPFLYSLATAPTSGGVFHFQMYPSLSGVVPAIVAILQQYGWTQMSIISQFDYPFLQLEFDIVAATYAENITVLQPSHIREEDDPADVPYLFAQYARVIFLNMYEDKATEVLCHAFQEGKYYPDYVWILYGWYSNNWWTRTPTSCNSSALLTALERAIILQSYPTTPYTVTEGYGYSYIPPLVDDSVQLLTQALDKSVDILCSNSGGSVGPCNASASLGDVLSSAIQESNFEGESGHVQFDGSGTRGFNQVELFQFRNGSASSRFASVQLENGEFYYEANEDNESVWPDGIPQDGSPIYVTNALSTVVVVFIDVFASLGIIFCFVCIGFNIVFRDRKVVKLTSPNLNYFIVVGALSLYINGLLRVIPSTDFAVWEHVCRAHVPLLGIGYAFCLGPVLAKTWRIYYIFHNPTTKKKEIKDWHLALIVLGILSICLVLISLGFIIPASRPTPRLDNDRENQPAENEKGIIENYRVINCYPPASFYWRLVLYFYLAVLQISALVLAIKIRNVKIKVLNDSKEISVIVFVTSALDVGLIIVTIALDNYINIRAIFFYGGVLSATTVFVGLIYVPKMYALYKDPKGKRIFGTKGVDTSDMTQKISQVAALEKRVQVLQARLEQQQTMDKTLDRTEDGSL